MLTQGLGINVNENGKERLRGILQSHLLREISDLQVRNGVMLAKTAKGWQEVCDLLREGKKDIRYLNVLEEEDEPAFKKPDAARITLKDRVFFSGSAAYRNARRIIHSMDIRKIVSVVRGN